MSLSPLASSCRAAVELFGAPILLQEGSGCRSRHVRSSSSVQQHQQHQQQQLQRSSSQTVACAALFVAASSRCRPRSRASNNSTRTGALRFAPALTKGKLKRRRRGSGSGSGDDDGYSSRWDEEAWQQLWNRDYGGGDNGNNGWGRGWGSGGNDSDPFHRVLFEWLWVWQLLCVASMLQSWYFMLFPRQTMADLDASPDAAELMCARVGMVY